MSVSLAIKPKVPGRPVIDKPPSSAAVAVNGMDLRKSDSERISRVPVP